MTRAAVVLTLSLLLLWPSGPCAKGPSTVALGVRGDRLTLRAEAAPLAAILQRIAEATGIVIYLEESVQERISANLTDVGLEEAMRRLLKHRNSIFLYGESRLVPSVVYVLGPRGGTLPLLISQPTGALALPSEPAEEDKVDAEGERRKTSLKIRNLEETLRAASLAESSEAYPPLQDLMADPDHSVRITALQWLAGSGDLGVDALAIAFRDGDDLVQRVAKQIMLDRGVGEQAVEEVTAAAEMEDERTIRQMLGALLAQQ